VGVEHTERTLLNDEHRLALALAVASERAARSLDRKLVVSAPSGHGGARHRRKGDEVFARFEGRRRRRFAGPLRGLTYMIEVGVKDPSISAFVEFGTGMYAAPERGGAHDLYVVTAGGPGGRGGRALEFPSAAGTLINRRRVFIEGTRPNPWVERTVDEHMPRIEEIYRQEVRRAIT
jgi:hypothetical protein